MKKININASRNYDVIIESGLLEQAGKYIKNIAKESRIVIVSDDNVFPLYGEKLMISLNSNGIDYSSFIFEHGECHKNFATYEKLLEFMSSLSLSRQDIVLALGGGVAGDMAGFAAATYQRGIGFIQMPTTLLAAVDASVGGKTAIDLKTGKNQVGAFYQPMLVLCDTDTFKTLPEKEYACGCAEIIKYAMISDESFLDNIMENPIKDHVEEVIAKCVSIKRDYVMEDEFDTGARMALNFGHTFGHAVEKLSDYNILHGQAVAIGMAIITKAACSKAICSLETCERLIKVLNKYDLPSKTTFSAEKIAEVCMIDKKSKGSELTLIVPESIGKYRFEKINKCELVDWLHFGGVE